MKSQRRHELEQNELAQWMGDVVQKIKPYQTLILGALLVVLVGTVAYALWSRRTGSQAATAWTALFEAMESNDLFQYDDVIEQYPGTRAAECAAVMAGDYHLSGGCRLLFENKANANQELRRAAEYYLQVLETSDDSSLRERATFGLARALEAQARDLDEAVARYREVVENWPDGAFAVAAQRRIEDLKRSETKAMYDRFAQFDPKPAFSDEPGVPGQRPPFDLDDLPEGSPLFTPSSPFGSSPDAAPAEGAAVPLELPGTPAEPAATPAEPDGRPAEPPSAGDPAGTPAEPPGTPAQAPGTGEPGVTPAEPSGESSEAAGTGEPAGESAPAGAVDELAPGAESTGSDSPVGSAGTTDESGQAERTNAPEASSEAAPVPAPAPADRDPEAQSPGTSTPRSTPADGS